MAKSLVLHIGDAKTGSSSIQRALFGHKVASPEVSLDYPPLVNAFVLANTLKRGVSESERSTRFASYAHWADQSKADIAVISAEQFSGCQPELVNAAFQEHLATHAGTMRVICYVRPHVSRFVSAYAQRTKTGGVATDPEDFFLSHKSEKLLNAHARLMKWRDIYGERFLTRPFARNELLNGDVVADFMNQVLDGKPFRLLEDTVANVSLTYEALAGLRLLQISLRKNGASDHTRHAIGSRLSTLISMRPTVAGRKIQISKVLYQRIRSKCMEDAQNLDRDFFKRPLMVPALEKEADEAIDENLDCNAVKFMPRRQIMAIRQAGRALAEAVLANPGAWEMAFSRDKGHKPHLLGNETFPAAAQKTIATVDALLAEAAALLADVWSKR